MSETESASREMPRYKCHKVVHALKIGSIHRSLEGMTLYPVESGFAPVKVSANYITRHAPASGGYYVVYPDGYESYSPAKAFEEGYTRLE